MSSNYLTRRKAAQLLTRFIDSRPKADRERIRRDGPNDSERRAFQAQLAKAEAEAEVDAELLAVRGGHDWDGDIDDWPGCWV